MYPTQDPHLPPGCTDGPWKWDADRLECCPLCEKGEYEQFDGDHEDDDPTWGEGIEKCWMCGETGCEECIPIDAESGDRLCVECLKKVVKV